MIIKELSLKNFLTHKKETVTFPSEGIFLMAGDSGVGKSSFLEAIGFALYGYHATRAKTIEELRNNETEDNQEMLVKLTCLNSHGEEFVITRGLKNEKSTSFIEVVTPDGTLVQGPSNTKPVLEELLSGLDAKTFYMSFFAKQNELATLSKMRGVERRGFIYKMLGIDLLENITKEVSSNIRDLKTKTNVFTEQLPSDEELIEINNNKNIEDKQLINNLALLQQILEEIEINNKEGKEKNEAKNNIEKLQDKYKTISNEVSFLEKEKLPQILKIADEQKTRDNEIDKQLIIFEKNKTISEEFNSINNRLEEILQEKDFFTKREKIKNEIIEINNKIKTINIDNNDYQEKIKDKTKTYNNLKAEKISIKNKQEELESNLKLLEHEKVCITCLRSLDDKEGNAVINNLETNIDNAKNNLKTKEEEINKIEKDLSLLNQKKEVQEKELVKLSDFRKNIKKLEEDLLLIPDVNIDLNKLKNEYEIKKDKQEELKINLKNYEYAKEFLKNNKKTNKNYDDEIIETKIKIKNLNKKLENINFNETLYSELEKEVTLLLNNHTLLKDLETKQIIEIQNNIRNIKEFEKNILNIDYLKSKIESEEKNVDQLNELKILFQDFKQKLSGQIRPQMEEITGEMFSILSNGKFTNIRIDENYEIYVEHNGEEIPIRLISGGEEERANLCLRVALTRLVSFRYGAPIRFIVLDEIFGAQDTGNRQLIIDSLEEIKNFYPQIFLVSHVGDLQDSEFINAIVSFNENKTEEKAEVIIRA